MAQMVTFYRLSAYPNGCIATVRALDLSGTGYGLGLAKGHAVRTDTFSSKVKGLTHIGEFHAPAMLLARRGAAIEFRTAFVTGELLHFTSSC